MRRGWKPAVTSCFGLTVAAVLLGATPLQAEPQQSWMTDAQIHGLLVGHQVTGIYPNGSSWTETMKADGTTALTEGSGPSTGHWTLAGGLLCFKYRETGGGCFRYVVRGQNCYEHFFQLTPDDASQSEWLPGRPVVTNGRLWRTDQPKSCEPHLGS
jgi:hypothetical protein